MLDLTGFSKEFNGVTVLDGVDFSLAAGEVHALLGENGAGKSTLINLIVGIFPRSGGRMQLKGDSIDALTPQIARELGIAAVFQEFSLAPDLTVTENLTLAQIQVLGRNKEDSIARGMKMLDRLLHLDFGFLVNRLHPILLVRQLLFRRRTRCRLRRGFQPIIPGNARRVNSRARWSPSGERSSRRARRRRRGGCCLPG